MFDNDDLGRISPIEQADALRTLLAVFATSVVREGGTARNAVSAEILDILDEVPVENLESSAQLFTMMALRLRRRGRPRGTLYRQAIEAAVLTRSFRGAPPTEGEGAYLAADRPGLGVIDTACRVMLARLEKVAPAERRAWLSAEALAAALVASDAEETLGGPDREAGDLAVAEFLLRAVAQYLAATGTTDKPGR